MKDASLHFRAAEQMAGCARDCGESVEDLYAHSYEFRFRARGHGASEEIEHAVDITPELIARATKILAAWEAEEVRSPSDTGA